jgi:hypothetical protein
MSKGGLEIKKKKSRRKSVFKKSLDFPLDGVR